MTPPQHINSTSFCVSVAVLLHVAYLVFDCADKFKLIPANTVLSRHYFWNVLTAPAFETNSIALLIKLPVLAKCLLFLESQCSRAKVALYLVVVALVSSLVVFAMRVALYAAIGEEYLFKGNCGMAGVTLASLLAVISVDPSARLYKVVKFQDVVVPCVVVMVLLDTLGASEDLGFLVVASVLAPVLLKKYKMNPDAIPVALHSIVPANLQPLVHSFEVIVATVFKITPPTLEQKSTDAQAFEVLQMHKPDPVAERRRARALKALDAKLAQISQEPEIPLDDEDEGGVQSMPV